MLRFSKKIACLIGVCGLSACSGAQLPPDYSAEYVRIPVASEDNPQKVRHVLVPEACLTRDTSTSDHLGETLPPGCANAYNIQRMAENKKDLVYGQKLGKGSGKTAAKAAEKYLDGEQKDDKLKVKKPEEQGDTDVNGATQSLVSSVQSAASKANSSMPH